MLLNKLISFRMFSATATTQSLQNHRLFPKVDWERVEAGNYAVVDPVNPAVILYLSEQDYIVMVRVAITSNRTLKVLAGPSDSRPETTTTTSHDPHTKTPHLPKSSNPWGDILNFDSLNQTSQGRRGKRRFLNIFNSRLVEFLSNKNISNSTQFGVRGIKMVQLSTGNVRQWFRAWHSQVSWWSRGSTETTVHTVEANSFGLYLLKVLKRNGIGHLISRLKIMLFVVNAYLGGRKLTSTQNLGFRVRLRNGLPAALPLFVRAGIRAGNRHYIHIWTSMLFSYKGILGVWQEPNIAKSSITQPHPNLEESSALRDFSDFAKILWSNWTVLLNIKSPDLRVKNYFFSTKAGPNSPMTILGAGFDAYLWFSLDLLSKASASSLVPLELMARLRGISQIIGVESNYIREWLEVTNQPELLLQLRKTAKMFALNQRLAWGVIQHNQNSLSSIIYKVFKPSRFVGLEIPRKVRETIRHFLGNKFLDNFTKKHNSGLDTSVPVTGSFTTKEVKLGYEYIYEFLGLNLKLLRTGNPTLQRLHNLYEAAGKVRTIAIVDYWTNFVLKPLHDWMFNILSLLPQDATFDQEGRVLEFSKRGYSEVWSYDLKSATDLIPLILYKRLFGPILPEKVLAIWIKLLISRDFRVPSSTKKTFENHPETVRYSTGQPMGALTSWASMALVHHALVLFAAVRCGVSHPSNLLAFIDYMVLGDDIVIAHKAVAEEYKKLMVELQVPLSLAKSHISEHGMFNFANQTFIGEMNASPVSLREDINANSMAERIELALRLVRRGWKDLGSRVWVAYLSRLLLPQRVWALLTPDIRNGKVPLLIRWILAVLLTPGTTRYSWAGYSNVALETFLGAQLRKGDLFSMSIDQMGDLIDRHRSGKVLISILGKWSSKVYAQFLSSRKSLEEDYKVWVRRSISVDLEWLFNGIFLDSVKSAIDRWSTKYRYPLKAIQICTNLSHFDISDVEAGTGKPWSSLVALVADAEAALPIVPDFVPGTLDALSQVEVPGEGASNSEYQIMLRRDRQARESLLRVTNLLGMIDHLGPSGTPGFVEAWDHSQLDSDQFLAGKNSK